MSELADVDSDVAASSAGRSPALLRAAGLAIEFFALQPEQVRELWPMLAPRLRAFEAKTALASPEEVLLAVSQLQAQLWAGWDGTRIVGVVVTQIHQTAQGRFCNLWLAESDLPDSREIAPQALAVIEKWAREIGCFAVEIVGRAGWARVLNGYRRQAVVMHKHLHVSH
ncbi:MAG: hypothetical protein WDO56_35150 [Gammaproteobacteria bacterium]